HGRRWSASQAYLRPVRRRPNLEVRTRTLVTRVVLDGGRAVGVEIAKRGGIGPADNLRGLGIDVASDLPGVGANPQDHLEVYIQHASTQPVSMQPAATQKWRRPFIGAQWQFF